MATEYKLSYTAQEIDEKLGKIDDFVTQEQVAEILPSVTKNDAGKFLRVSSTGVWEVQTIKNAEEVAY